MYVNLDILTLIRVVIHSLKLCGTNNYMITIVYLQLFVFNTEWMELPSKLLEQIVFNTRSKIEEQMLVVIDKSTHEVHLSQPLQTNIKQFKIAVTFLTACKSIFNVTNSNKKLYFLKSITDDHHIKVIIPPGAYEIESLNN